MMFLLIMDMADSAEDKAKVERLYDEYEGLMYYIAEGMLHSKEDIEDALMSAWEKIIRHINKISEISCPKTKSFIVIVTERASIDIYRKNKNRRKVEIQIDEYENSPFFSIDDKHLDDVILYELLDTMPKKYGEVLLLYYLEDMSVKEIADILGISADAVNKRLQRARDVLKKEISD